MGVAQDERARARQVSIFKFHSPVGLRKPGEHSNTYMRVFCKNKTGGQSQAFLPPCLFILYIDQLSICSQSAGDSMSQVAIQKQGHQSPTSKGPNSDCGSICLIAGGPGLQLPALPARLERGLGILARLCQSRRFHDLAGSNNLLAFNKE